MSDQTPNPSEETSSESPTGNTARELQARAGAALGAFDIEVRVDSDSSLRFDFEGALCSLSALTLVSGLDVLTLTCVLVWDHPIGAGLHEQTALLGGGLQFGSLVVSEHDEQADVVLRYTFPATGLGEEALGIMLLLVLSGARQTRKELLSSGAQ